MAMACSKIVAEPLTLTGSIGVVAGKINASALFGKVGYSKETLSRGRFAEISSDSRGFTPEEEAYFKASAMSAYRSFRDKAAYSRGLSTEAMEAIAQGRVWTGQQALSAGLVDALGGIRTAVAIAKAAAGIGAGAPARVLELTPAARPSLVQLVGGASLGMMSRGPLGGAMGAERALKKASR